LRFDIFNRSAVLWALLLILWFVFFVTPSYAQNPLGSFTPVELQPILPYRIELREYSMDEAELPTLHSFAVGRYESKWLFISGRTNGLHGFDAGFFPEDNFPIQHQNRDIWVLDLASKQSWTRSLDDPSSGLSEAQIVSLSATNNQFYDRNETLYITGGYGVHANGIDFGTFDALSAIDLPGLGDWVIIGNGSAAEHIRQIHDPVFKVTGGAMHRIGDRTHIVFGQDFDGLYTLRWPTTFGQWRGSDLRR